MTGPPRRQSRHPRCIIAHRLPPRCSQDGLQEAASARIQKEIEHLKEEADTQQLLVNRQRERREELDKERRQLQKEREDEESRVRELARKAEEASTRPENHVVCILQIPL